MRAILSAATCAFIALQVYHYFIYPIILSALATLASKRTPRDALTPTVSLLTAAYNERDVIKGKLENSLALDYPGLEIIVVSDGSTDGTDAAVESYAPRGVRLARLTARSGKAAALNLASGMASGEVLVISDAN